MGEAAEDEKLEKKKSKWMIGREADSLFFLDSGRVRVSLFLGQV